MREWKLETPAHVDLELRLNKLEHDGWTIFQILVSNGTLGVVAYRDNEKENDNG